MAEYKALRVPIALLQQRVYGTPRRLEKLKHLVLETKPERKVVETRANIETSVIQGARTEYKVFWGQGDYLRRFFYAITEDSNSKLVCRGCGGRTADVMGRSSHAGGCFPAINRVLSELMDKKECVICERPVDKGHAALHYNSVPVCSHECLRLWDGIDVDTFKVAYQEYLRTLRDRGRK